MDTHYEAFDSTRTREMVRDIDFRYTPKHRLWLSIAEIELSGMTKQSSRRRHIDD